MLGNASEIKYIRPRAQSPKITRGKATSEIKHSFFRDSRIKSNASRDLERQKEKTTKNVRLILRTLTMTRSGKRKLLILKVPSMIRRKLDTNRLTALSYLR
jgi:hypothetical protein